MQTLLTAVPESGVDDCRINSLARSESLCGHWQKAMIGEGKPTARSRVLEVVVCTKFGLESILLPQPSYGQEAMREVWGVYNILQDVVLRATVLVGEFESNGADTLSTNASTICDCNVHGVMLVINCLEHRPVVDTMDRGT